MRNKIHEIDFFKEKKINNNKNFEITLERTC